MIDDRASADHVTDEDLLLDYYGEGSRDRTSLQVHLEGCAECRALDREQRAVLSLVDSTPPPDVPEGFESEMWARIEPLISARARLEAGGPEGPPLQGPPLQGPPLQGPSLQGPLLRGPFLRRWALAGGIAALVVAAFALGRVWERAPVVAPESADANAVTDRLFRTEVEDHFERSQRALVELVNADDSGLPTPAADRSRAADLVAAGRLYRRSAEAIGDPDMRDLLEDVERVLVEVANGSPDVSSNDLSGVRARITDQDLIVRLRMTTSEMRERERRARPTW